MPFSREMRATNARSSVGAATNSYALTSIPLATMRALAAIAAPNVSACARLCIATDFGSCAIAAATARSISSLSEPMLTRCATGAAHSAALVNGSASYAKFTTTS